MFGGRKKQKHVVISYASGDRRDALVLADELEAAGVRVWIAPRDIDPTQGTAAQTHEAIRASAAILLIVSAAANQSKVLKNEAEIAVGHAPIVPVRIEDVAPAQALHSLVQGQAAYDLFGDARSAEFSRLVAATLELLGAARGKRRPPPRRITSAKPDIVQSSAGEDAPASSLGPTPPAIGGRPPLTHMAALRHYIVRHPGPILEHWRAMDASGSGTRRFLAGLLFGRYWLAWRKLRWAAFASSLVAIALVGLALWTDGQERTIGTPIAILGILGLGILVWLRGLALYRAKAERQVERWNVAGYDPSEAAAALRRKGGTSALSVILLLVIEAVACVALAEAFDPGFVAWLTTPATAERAQRLDLVDMTRPADPRARYNFCIRNPTDLTINFTLRYANGSTDTQRIAPHGKALAFWTRSLDAPSISFDHELGDGDKYSDRSYVLNMAKTDSERSCGGMIYYFITTDRDVDLKRQEQMMPAAE